MEYDQTYLEDCIHEAAPYHDRWLKVAKVDTAFARGKQWDEGVESELEAQNRPCLTLNVISPLIRLLTGIERKSRYDMRALPVGDSDSDTARVVTGLIKQIEYENNAQYIYSESYRSGLVWG